MRWQGFACDTFSRDLLMVGCFFYRDQFTGVIPDDALWLVAAGLCSIMRLGCVVARSHHSSHFFFRTVPSFFDPRLGSAGWLLVIQSTSGRPLVLGSGWPHGSGVSLCVLSLLVLDGGRGISCLIPTSWYHRLPPLVRRGGEDMFLLLL